MIANDAHGEKRRNYKDAGRACPVDYHLSESIFAADSQVSCDTLYVVGGLYGNPFALNAIEEMVAAEEAAGRDVLVVLNGDIHWFDKTAENFLALERRLDRPRWIPLVGNVEAELRRQEDIGVGCGCGYPACTSDASVSRSNRIHRMLSIAVHEHPECKEPLIGRAAAMTVDVAGEKVGITHGDEKLIGGWDCSRDSLQDPLRQDELSQFMDRNGIDVLRELNELGYGRAPRLVLDLTYNPQTPILCPEQAKLADLYKRRLRDAYGIEFNNLFAVANCPIGRYGVHLLRTGDLEAYMDLLMDSFNAQAADGMMCRHQISVGYDGRIYDCDFNQAVDLVQQRDGRDLTIFDYAADPALPTAREILFGHHCYACTAGQGSSCEGTLVQGEFEIPMPMHDAQ